MAVRRRRLAMLALGLSLSGVVVQLSPGQAVAAPSPSNAAASYPERNATVVPLNAGTPFQLTDHDPIRTVAILALAPDASLRTPLSAPDDVALNIDVADHVITARTRRGGQPPTGPSPYLLWHGLAAVLAIALLVVAVTVLVVRLQRSNSGRPPGWVAATVSPRAGADHRADPARHGELFTQ